MTMNDYRNAMTPRPSRRQMCLRMGLSWNTYHKYENDPDAPRYYRLAAWAVAHNSELARAN